MHINVISNGMGAPSMMLCVLAAEENLNTKLSITADTGSELDRVWSNGKRTTAKEYFDEVIEPYCKDNGIEAAFVRSVDKDKNPLPPIHELLKKGITAGVPLYGSEMGQLPQRCTGKWKIRAIRQELRRRGAKTAISYLGLTLDEVHRVKPSDVKWCQNDWPLIMRWKFYKATVQHRLEKRGIPYLLSSECDMCPHQNRPRWERTSPEKIDEIAEMEKQFIGQYFTPMRIPLKKALERWDDGQTVLDSCDQGYCFV